MSSQVNCTSIKSFLSVLPFAFPLPSLGSNKISLACSNAVSSQSPVHIQQVIKHGLSIFLVPGSIESSLEWTNNILMSVL